jgi:hypothetical protein
MDNRRGPWSKTDKKYIEVNYKEKSVEEIANVLKRNEKAVKKYIDGHFADAFTLTSKEAEYDIKKSQIWNDIKKQFSSEELEMFLYNWGRIISQFKDDVFPTEQMQVIDTIKLDILMNRSLTEQQLCMNDIRSNQRMLEQEREKGDDIDLISSLERQIAVLRAAQDSFSSNYKDMLEKKNKILKDMKATRDGRIKHVESYKHSFSGWMIKLMADRVLRRRLGTQMEKMRLSAEEERRRLSEWHIYADGEGDLPLLTPDTVKE